MSTLCYSKIFRATLIAVLALVVSVEAAVLTYPIGYSQDDDNPDVPAGTAGASVSSTYGDNITQADIDAGYYGAAGGPTPDVLVWNDWENVNVKVSDDDYGDLPSVLCSPYGWYMIEFKTDNNYLIDLHSFDMASRVDEGADIEIDILIDGETVKTLTPYIFGKEGMFGVKHVHFDTGMAEGDAGIYGFGQISGRHIGIRIWPRPLAEDVGITNIQFSQREDFQAFNAEPVSEANNVTLATSALTWASHDDVEYDVRVSTDADLAATTPIRVAETTLNLSQTALPLGEMDPNVTYYWRVDTVQAEGTVTNGPLWSFTTVPAEAFSPQPLTGSVNQYGLGRQLSWSGPEGWEHVRATYHVYLSDNQNTLTLISPTGGLGECSWLLNDSLKASTAYYWRVDTVIHDTTYTGTVWSFDTALSGATNPLPIHEGMAVAGSNLRWIPGANALSHRVYLGTNANLGADDLKVETEEASFKPAEPLNVGETYYWRVDEVVSEGTVIPGDLWQFTVDVLPADGLIVALTPETPLVNGDCVENWRDLSGHNNDALMHDQESRPWLLSSPATGCGIVDFDGIDDHLIIGSNPEDFDGNTFTWFVVGIPLHASDTMAMISSGYVGGSCWGWHNRLWGTAWEDSTWITWVKSPGKVSVVNNGTPEQLAVVSGVWDGDNLWQYVDSVCADSIGAGSDGNPESHKFTLLGSGFAQPGKGNYLKGQIAEVLVYNRTLRPEEKATIDSYLSAKYDFIPEIPMNPGPPDNSKHVDLEVTLDWDGPAGATYDVFFKDVDAADWTQVATGISTTEVVLPALTNPLVLEYEKKYEWRVDMWINGQRLKGIEWHFETWIPYCSEPIPGDLNDDCVVDVEDITLLLQNWLQSN
jgi:hypothetical protein